MRIFDKVPEELVLLKLKVEDKRSLFEKMAAVLASYGYVEDEYDLVNGLMEREEIMSTGIGQGMAVPHTDLGGTRHFVVVVATLDRPIEFHAHDGKPVDVVFTLLVPQDRFDLLSRLLAAVSRTLRDGSLLTRLRRTADAGEALAFLKASEDQVRSH